MYSINNTGDFLPFFFSSGSGFFLTWSYFLERPDPCPDPASNSTKYFCISKTIIHPLQYLVFVLQQVPVPVFVPVTVQ